MDLLSLPVAVVAAVSVALLSRAVRYLWLRAVLVVAAAYGGAFVSLTVAAHISTDDQFRSWAPVLLHLSFGIGTVIGVVVLFVSYWLLKPGKRQVK